MKIFPRGQSTRQTNEGSILATTLVATFIIGIGLASYLSLAGAQSRSVVRSALWNSALPLAEAGLEEGLTQLYHKGTNTPGNNWIQGTNNILYTKTRSVGTNGGYYKATLELKNNPTVTVTGYIPLPWKTNEFVSRTVKIDTKKSISPAGGLIARNTIKFSGGSFLDSFDSSDPAFSTNGVYTLLRRKDNGKASANSGAAGAITLSGGSGIIGTAVTGPGGTVVDGGGARIGDLAWWAGLSVGVLSGSVANNANVDFPPVQVPFVGGGFTPMSGTYNGTNYTYLIDSGNYYTASKISMQSSDIMAVKGNAVLYVDNDFTATGQSVIYIYPGASLKLYVRKAFAVGGQGMVNATQKAANLSIYGLNTSTENWSYSGGASFIGTVYAPNSDYTFSGGAGVYGSITSNNINISGGGGVHYDEALAGGTKGYLVTGWKEL